MAASQFDKCEGAIPVFEVFIVCVGGNDPVRYTYPSIRTEEGAVEDASAILCSIATYRAVSYEGDISRTWCCNLFFSASGDVVTIDGSHSRPCDS